jgi:hypothetical protein
MSSHQAGGRQPHKGGGRQRQVDGPSNPERDRRPNSESNEKGERCLVPQHAQPAQVDDEPPPKVYRNAFYDARKKMYRFRVMVSEYDRYIYLGWFSRANAERGVRLQDAVQVLLCRLVATTTNPFTSITKADIEEAARILRKEGVNVEEAVLKCAAWGTGLLGVKLAPAVGAQGEVLWCTDLSGIRVGRGGAAGGELRWGAEPDIAAAARQADAGRLAMLGPGTMTNYPASWCPLKMLAEVAAFLVVAEGVSAELVQRNVDNVERVRVRAVPAAGVPWVYALGARGSHYCVCDVIHCTATALRCTTALYCCFLLCAYCLDVLLVCTPLYS